MYYDRSSKNNQQIKTYAKEREKEKRTDLQGICEKIKCVFEFEE